MYNCETYKFWKVVSDTKRCLSYLKKNQNQFNALFLWLIILELMDLQKATVLNVNILTTKKMLYDVD
jgi:hypothetical protein